MSDYAADCPTTKEQLKRALESERQARATQDAFLAAVSHDMRTPLNAICGYSEALASGVAGPLTAQQSGYAADIVRAARQLNDLVQDIIDANAISRGALSVECAPTPAAEIVDYVIAINKPAAEARRVKIRVSSEPDAQMRCDPVRARQCLTNLVDNAVKFSPDGGSIHIAIEPIDDRIAISVSDFGPGITCDDIKTALSLFGQVDAKRLRGAGVGLGLPISQQLMRLQGGDLHVVSQPGVGSTFSLVFPAARTPDPNPPA